MWIRFTSNWDWTPPSLRRISMAFPRGYCGQVTHDCGEAAIAAGAAERADPPPREEREATQREPLKARRKRDPLAE